MLKENYLSAYVHYHLIPDE